MNITEKILAKAAGLETVTPDQIIDVAVDRAFTHEKLGPLFFDKFRKMNLKIWDKERAILFADHGNPPSRVMDADLIVKTADFAEDYGLKFYNGEGICHQLMPEKGYVLPGRVIVGTDSHTTTYGAFGAFSTGLGSTEMAWIFNKGRIWMKVPHSLLFRVSGRLGPFVMGKDLALHIMKLTGAEGASYKAMEFTGSAITAMELDGRMTLCNMTVEAGAKNGIIETDEKVIEYLKGRTSESYEIFKSDADSVYEKVFEIDGNKLEPTISLPGSSANSVPVREAAGIPFTRALLGTCTNGRMEDFRVAAKILKGRKVHPKVRLQVIPASRSIFQQCIEEGITQIFLEAGAIWGNPNCGPCAGGHYGLLGKDEVCVSTSNRNMEGRMGDRTAKIYLASPATVAASAVNGKITDPREYL
ncbi:MAG: aconitase/3-isopropylmalate dehydratase large subunit family protein [Flexilinea sp.]